MATKKKASVKKSVAPKKAAAKHRSSSAVSTASRVPSDFIGMLDYYLVKKAPVSMPTSTKEWTVRFGPWVLTALLLLFVPIVLGLLGFGYAVLPLGIWEYPKIAAGATFGFASFIIYVAVILASLPGLFARTKQGWNLALMLVLFNTFFGLLNLRTVSAVLSLVLGMYVLFQVRSYYK